MKKKESGKPWYKKWWAITIFIIVGIIILSSLFGNENSSSDNSSSNSNTNSGTSKNEIATYGLNEPIVIGEFEYVFTRVDEKDFVGSSYFGEEASGTYLIFYLEITNLGDEADYINDEIYFIDEEGREFSQDDDAMWYLDDYLIWEELNPTMTQKAQIIFDIPEDYSGKLCIKKSLYSNSCGAYISW